MDKKEIYELGYLILPSISEDTLPAVVAKAKEAVEKVSGKIFDGEEPIKVDLAYTISKTVGASKYVVDDAYIGWMKFDLPAEVSAQTGLEHPIEALKAELSKMDELLRFILVKAPRETTFTFAKAREAEREEALEEVAEEEPAVVVE